MNSGFEKVLGESEVNWGYVYLGRYHRDLYGKTLTVRHQGRVYKIESKPSRQVGVKGIDT